MVRVQPPQPNLQQPDSPPAPAYDSLDKCRAPFRVEVSNQERKSPGLKSLCENSKLPRSCRACLQAGNLDSSRCPLEGGRNMDQNRVRTRILKAWAAELAGISPEHCAALHFRKIPNVFGESIFQNVKTFSLFCSGGPRILPPIGMVHWVWFFGVGGGSRSEGRSRRPSPQSPKGILGASSLLRFYYLHARGQTQNAENTVFSFSYRG